MNKFISGIVAGKSTLASRATQLSNLVENAVKQNLIEIEGQISNLEMERASLLDFAPNTTDSLRPGNGKMVSSSQTSGQSAFFRLTTTCVS